MAISVMAVVTATACGTEPTPTDPRDGGSGDGSADATDGPSDSAPKPGDPCTTQADCDDGVFCNGVEECLAGRCTSARNIACKDSCAVATCVEAAGGCSLSLPTCPSTDGCTSPTDPRCDDGRACTDDRCEVATGRCLHVPVDGRCPAVGACGVGVCLGEGSADPSGCGAKPDAARCKETEGCVGTSCVALPTTCVTDRDCTDHDLCDGVERCVGGRCVHGARTTCAAAACHHAACKERSLGDPYCVEVQTPGCP